MAFEKPTYSPVDSDDNDKAFDFERAQQSVMESKGRLRNWVFLIIPTFISGATVLALLVLANSISTSSLAGNHFEGTPGSSQSSHHTYEPTTTGKWRSCGVTPTEARDRGCIFDTISFSWQVPDCYDSELVEAFSRLPNPFPFYADPAGTIELPWSEVGKGDRAMFVPWAHHLWHCGFLWRKMHRAIIAGKPVDSYIGSYGHTEHCTYIMVEENAHHDMSEVNTIMPLKFPYCGPGENQWVGGTNFTAHGLDAWKSPI